MERINFLNKRYMIPIVERGGGSGIAILQIFWNSMAEKRLEATPLLES